MICKEHVSPFIYSYCCLFFCFPWGFFPYFGVVLFVSWFFLHGYFVTALVFCSDRPRDNECELPKSLAVLYAGNGNVIFVRSFEVFSNTGSQNINPFCILI